MNSARAFLSFRRGPKLGIRLLRYVFLLLVFVSGCEEGSQHVGSKAAELKGEDVNGKTIALGQFQGKVVLLDFWATWCGPCRNEIPHELDLQRQFQGRPFAILGISRDEKREDLSDFLAKSRLPWPNIFDADGKIVKQWKVTGFPTFILIDHNGVVLNKWVGGGQINQIRAEVDKAVGAAEKK